MTEQTGKRFSPCHSGVAESSVYLGKFKAPFEGEWIFYSVLGMDRNLMRHLRQRESYLAKVWKRERVLLVWGPFLPSSQCRRDVECE